MQLCRAMMILAIVITACILAALAIQFPWLAVILAIAIAVRLGAKKTREYTSGGTARWAEPEDLERAGMFEDKPGLILGRIALPPIKLWAALNGLFDRRIPSAIACERFMKSLPRAKKPVEAAIARLTKATHIAVFAPTGAGKGVSIVIPFLLNCRDSCVVIDPKGENYQLTSAKRREQFGHRTIRIDPFGVCGKGANTFNPLDMIPADSPNLIDDCKALANALVIRAPDSKDPHWADSAELFITAVLIAVALWSNPDNRSLQTMREILANPHHLAKIIALLCQAKEFDGIVSRYGHQLTNFRDKELSGVMTTLSRFLNFLDTPAILETTSKSSFDISELRNGRTTIYLILPPEHLRTQSALMRMWIGTMLKAVVRGGLKESNKVHFVLDEAASLGMMDALFDAVDKLRGYGVRMIFIYQAMGQLAKCWGSEGGDSTLMSNVSSVFFAVNDPETAEYVSKRLGEATIFVESTGDNDGESESRNSPEPSSSRSNSTGRSRNWAQQARQLLKPEEVVALPARTAITFTPGVPPIYTHLTRYYEEEKILGNGRWASLKKLVEIWLAAVVLLIFASIAGLLAAGM